LKGKPHGDGEITKNGVTYKAEYKNGVVVSQKE
jgi:hypothetical protein